MNTKVAGLAVAGALVLGGCSLISPDSPAPTGPASAPPPASSSPPSAPGSTGPTTAPSTSAAPTAGSASTGAADQLGQPVATRKSAESNRPLVLGVYPVVREGATSHLNFTLSSDAKKADQVQIANLLSDSNGTTGDKGAWAADGLQLIDGKNSKVYLVASDGQGQCLCSRDLIGKYVYGGQPMVLSATFAAPPADVTTVDVRVPGFGTVVRVPVS